MELGDGNLGVISVFGLVKDVKLKFLLDTGASHNFLSLHDAKSGSSSIARWCRFSETGQW